MKRADPGAVAGAPSADCVVVTPDEAGDESSVVADLRRVGYRGPVVLFGSGTHETLASRVDELGATTYVRRDVTNGHEPWFRLAETVERVTTTASKRRETQLTLLHELARELMRVEEYGAVAATVVESIEDTLGADAAVVESTADGDGATVLAATTGFETELLDEPAIAAAVAAGTEEWTPAGGPEIERSGVLAVVPIGERGSLLVGGRGGVAVEFELVRALGATAEVAFDRAEREARIREERDRIASLFENTSDAIVDVENVDGEPIVRAVNTTFERVFGFTSDEVVGSNLDEFIGPEQDDTSAAYRLYGLAGGPFEREVRRSTADDVRDFLLRSVPFDREGTDRGYAIYTDITERKRIERTLGRLHETTRDLIRAESRMEIAEITVRAANDILGYPVTAVRLYEPKSETLRLAAVSEETESVLGERPTDGPEVDMAWEAFRVGQSKVVDDLSAHGVTDVGIDRAMYLPLGDGGLLTLGSTEAEGFDESDRRLAQILAANVEVALSRAARVAVLRDREDELARQNERLEAFASVVSHDLRNPLSVARGYLGLARDACPANGDDEDPAPHFERVERAHERMNRLITDLLALARQGQTVGTTQELSLEEAADRAWTAVETGTATLDVVDDRRIDADGERLGTLFENLFRNAVEHGSASSRPEAGDSVEDGSTDPADGDGTGAVAHVRVGPLDDGFFVEDDGPGIPESEREKVFERGYSTGDSGTGFGLSIVRGIAEAHGWALDVTASDSGGARFEVRGVDTAARERIE
ncbi:PAS domain-containing sensor histidine kinase [Salinigranum marinum]|uniref:PAS domain-containing sensor histidine kinase n=1 Tax=Salinigranum marinum TaxID=1515595 RepID=UPI002989E49C|nr:PAS domain-containing sensor histidine kinase [Salinigranum marinum]